jgi:hypothetical protein
VITLHRGKSLSVVKLILYHMLLSVSDSCRIALFNHSVRQIKKGLKKTWLDGLTIATPPTTSYVLQVVGHLFTALLTARENRSLVASCSSLLFQ